MKITEDSVNMKHMSHPAHRPSSITIGNYSKNLSLGRPMLSGMREEDATKIPSI